MNRFFNVPEVDSKQLSSNIGDILSGCNVTEGTLASELQDKFPLYNWLKSTKLSRTIEANKNVESFKKTGGKWKVAVPASYNSLPAVSTQGECCWAPFDFAKTAEEVELMHFCLKDCKSVDDALWDDQLKLTKGVSGLATKGMTKAQIQDKVARLSMAFLSNANIIKGVSTVETATLKPFHGLMEVMENTAVMSISGATGVINAFDRIGCRLAVLGGASDYVFAVHPVGYETIKASLVKDQNGEYPAGWEKSGDTVKFNGIAFIADDQMPIDLEEGTFEVWALSSEAVGLTMRYDIANPVALDEQFEELTYEQGCGKSCVWYYNAGAVVNNNADKIAKIVDIPVSTACTDGLVGINAIAVPETIVPVGERQ